MRYWLFVFFILSGTLKAQVINLPSDSDKFLDEYIRQTEQALGSSIKPFNTAFSTLYQNNLADAEKQVVISCLQMLVKKGLTPMDMVRVTELMVAFKNDEIAASLPYSVFVSQLQKAFEPQPTKVINRSISQLNLFYKNNELYSSNFSQVKVNTTKANFKFFDKKQSYFQETTAPTAESVEDIGWGEDFDNYDPWNDQQALKKDAVESRLVIPQAQGLFFVFENVDITFKSPSDSITILNTTGAYNFIDEIFIGEGGKIQWLVSDQPVEATLFKYAFRPSTGKILAEKVNLQHDHILNKAIEGALEIKLEKRPINQASTFPRFKSYHNNADYKLNMEDFDLLAGYTLVGNKVTTTSLFDKWSKFWVNKNTKTTQFEVIGHSLTVTDSIITSDRVSFVARFLKDSVSHPAIKMAYDINKQQLQLNKVNKGGFRNAMFSDSFHQVDIRCDAMFWDLKTRKMEFYIVAGKDVVAAEFESFDYFIMSQMSNLSSITGFNPLMAAANLVGKKKKNEVTIEEMMQITKKEKYAVSNGMLIGNQMGFFDYHPFENYYSISRKGLHYYFVLTGKKDYDDLIFSSLNKGGKSEKNATIDFNSDALDIRGAQNFQLSDSLGIKLLPNDQSMKVIGNKVFSFNGKIIVKNYTFYGDFVLEYEKFIVNLKRIDSITYIPLNIYKNGGKTELASNFKFGSTGTLYLNSPNNKSGRRNLPEYPKLEIPGGVKVRFNEKGRHQKFSDAVEFVATSISLDSLNATDPKILGIFTTGGIFNPIKDKLVLMPDTSMGMNHITHVAYPIYGPEGSLKTSSAIILDKKGISTSGEIKHLAATLVGQKINLYEDYTEASGPSGKIVVNETKAAFFPQVNISEYSMHWNPKKDSMSISSASGFEFYNTSTLLKGSLLMRTGGLFGQGDLARQDSDISSQNFKFNKTGFLAEKATLRVKAQEADKLAFLGKNVNIDFNVLESKVQINSQNNKDFNSNELAFLEFPSSFYKTTIDNALWNIKDKSITMHGTIENTVFTSTAPNQYGLKFNGTDAKYDVTSKNLSISGVEEIHSADAAIRPAGGKVFVKNDGKLEPFTRATIIADTLNRFHTLANANVNINSRLSYSGNADYQYVNISSDTFNIKLGGFEFAEVSPEGKILSSKGSGKLSTIARASVSEKDQVFLSKKMLYKGELTMLAPFKNLSLKGQVLPDLKKYPMIGGSWIDYEGSKSENVSINIDETLKDGGKPLYVGLHMKYGANSDGIYPSFLSMKGSSDDNDIIVARGQFGRDEPNKVFYVQPLTQPGNGATFDEEKGILEFSGQFNLLGVASKVFETVGKVRVDLDSMKYRFSTMMLLDFPIPIPTTQKLGQNIVKANLDAGNTAAAIDVTSEEFIEKLKQIGGIKNTEKFIIDTQKGHIPLFKASDRFLKTLVLSDLNLVWNTTANAYYSVGPVGISNIGDVDINALTNTYVEIVQSHTTGNEINVYMDLSPTIWCYLVYRNGQLSMVSSDEEINKLINTGGVKEKEKGVNFIDIVNANLFKKRFLMNYKGLSEEEFNTLSKNPTKVLPGNKKTQKTETEGF